VAIQPIMCVVRRQARGIASFGRIADFTELSSRMARHKVIRGVTQNKGDCMQRAAGGRGLTFADA